MIEMLEKRQLLTNLVAVNVTGGAVTLTDISDRNADSGDAFSISYNATQVILTAQSGTMFQVGGQNQSTYTASVTGPISIGMTLNSSDNAVTVIGDGTTVLSSFTADFGDSRNNNALTLANVISNSVSVTGGRHDDMVTLQNCTVNNNLSANLGNRRNSADGLILQNTTIKGNVTARTDQFVSNLSTITGSLDDVQSNKFSSFSSTGSTFTGAVSVRMGRDGVMFTNSSSSGQNQFQSSVNLTGARRHETRVFEQANSVKFTVAPNLSNASVTSIPSPVPVSVLAKPTVNSLTNVKNTSTVTGTYDATNARTLTVNANNKTYTLGTDSQLTATASNWSLNLSSAPLSASSTTVTAATTDAGGASQSATGTVTTNAQLDSELTVIHNFISSNSLTAVETASGLNYVITTNGTGAIPHTGQKLTVNYSGFLLKADGTQGTEFDSNVDAQFNHVTPFQFNLGSGVIQGWTEAFALLPVGTIARLIIPSNLAYGTAGQGSNIPANATLIFNVTLVSAV